MKKDNYSQAYRNLGFEKINAPAVKDAKNSVKAVKISGADLRIGGKKK